MTTVLLKHMVTARAVERLAAIAEQREHPARIVLEDLIKHAHALAFPAYVAPPATATERKIETKEAARQAQRANAQRAAEKEADSQRAHDRRSMQIGIRAYLAGVDLSDTTQKEADAYIDRCLEIGPDTWRREIDARRDALLPLYVKVVPGAPILPAQVDELAPPPRSKPRPPGQLSLVERAKADDLAARNINKSEDGT